MPKVVDHAARRVELIETTWRIIARDGLEGATLREVAAAAGFANGALKPYFPTKSTLLEATFRHVLNRTNERAQRATEGKSGVDAVRAFALEVLPTDEEKLTEARVVIVFWQSALHDPRQAELNAESIAQWRAQILGWLGTTGSPDVEALFTFLLGAQISAAATGSASGESLTEQLDALLDRLR